MKKFIILLFLVTAMTNSYSQDFDNQNYAADKKKYESILSSYQREDYLDAVIGLNEFIRGYTSYSRLYLMRAGARMKLNDYKGARVDFAFARGSGETDPYIDYMLKKQSLIKRLMQDTGVDLPLDSLRDYRPVIQESDKIRGALRPERTSFDVYFYDLRIKILPESKSIEGTNSIYFKTTENTSVIQIDLFPEYNITAIKLRDKDLKFTRKYGGVFIELGETFPAGISEVLTVEYNGTPRVAPRPPWDGGFVWEKEKRRYQVGVACEHLGASSWWPCKDHLSDKPDSMRINLEVPSGYKGISNGSLRSVKEEANGFTDFEWFVSYPINTYAVTVYMGDFVNFNEQFKGVGDSYQIDYYVLPNNLGKAQKYYAQTKDIFSIYENLFGEYPFKKDGAGMVESSYEGMENQGAIAIGGEYGKSSNKRPYSRKDFDYLLIHESAHEWWGNAVAVGDMADAWISEGFATYAEYLFAEEKFGYPEYIRALASNDNQILNLWPVVGERDINEDTFFGGDIYNKGAAMLNNLRCCINNDTLFKKIIKDFYVKSKYKIVTTSDFTNLVNEYTKTDYSDFFRVFLYETEPPELSCKYEFDGKNNLTFKYRWTNVGKNFTMPFCVAVSDKEYVRLVGTTLPQTFTYEKAKTFFLPNEHKYDKDIVPKNSFTYYWTTWPDL